VTGSVQLPDGTEMVMPGDKHQDGGDADPADRDDQGLRFAVREGGKTVGAGVVAKILNRVEGQPCKTRESESRLKAFDYKLIDQSAVEIVDGKRTGAVVPDRTAADANPALRTCCARRT